MQNPSTLHQKPVEIELKLGLHTSDPAGIERLLCRTPALARRKPSRQQLINTYYDTPQETLHRQRVALRIRCTGSATHPQWVQTLKTGGASTSALSQRGEWEAAVPGPQLALPLLEATPWSHLDPDGTVFVALAPRFTTRFERTSWIVRQRDGSVVEVSLDIGQIVAGNRSAPICELELELVAGDTTAVFRIADQIARRIAVIPLNISKAERGYALGRDTLHAPLRASPPALTANLPLHAAAQQVLREMFCQFTTNLGALQTSDNPEAVHQARVGWRRFRSALKLFRKAPWVHTRPPLQPLRPVLNCLGELRDLDVASSQTLPSLANAYTAGSRQRQGHWREMEDAFAQATNERRQAVRAAVATPSAGRTLLEITAWLEHVPTQPDNSAPKSALKTPLRRWAKRRVARLHERLQAALRRCNSAKGQHRARILSKQLRYGTEALMTVLPKRRTGRWHQEALRLQTELGAARDMQHALVIATQLNVNHKLVAFLRSACSAGNPQPGKTGARRARQA